MTIDEINSSERIEVLDEYKKMYNRKQFNI